MGQEGRSRCQDRSVWVVVTILKKTGRERMGMEFLRSTKENSSVFGVPICVEQAPAAAILEREDLAGDEVMQTSESEAFRNLRI